MIDFSSEKNSKVFKFFQDISMIPHGSGNTGAISSWLEDFAKENKLSYVRDAMGNLIMFKDAAAGYESVAPVMLQGHMDMVCEKEADCNHDFTADPLKLILENGVISAEGTTLGGDDGVGVAYMLALLADPEYKGPALECVFTVDEETGMYGAYELDLSPCKARRLINLDTETEGEFIVGCAGGTRLISTLSLTREPAKGKLLSIELSGFKGGHSGDEINKKLGNAIILLSRFLHDLQVKGTRYGLVDFKGGAKDNAIPRMASCAICTEADISPIAKEYEDVLTREYRDIEDGINVSVKTINEDISNHDIISPTVLNSFFLMTYSIPNGVISMSKAIHGLTETSTNLGIVTTDGNEITCTYLLRSSVATRLESLKQRMLLILDNAGAKTVCPSSYPGWEYAAVSPLRESLADHFEKTYGKAPKITAIHGGLECGILLSKAPYLDIVSLGPDIIDIHTPAERMSTESVSRTYDFLVSYLSSLKA